MTTTKVKKRRRLTDYLTPDDRRELRSIADQLDGLIAKHKREGAIPMDALKFLRYRLERLGKGEGQLPLGWESTEPAL